VTDAGLAHLKSLTALSTLVLDDTQINDAGLTHLKDLRSLSELDVHNTHVTDDGVKELQQALPKLDIRR
jgi:internalin A